MAKKKIDKYEKPVQMAMCTGIAEYGIEPHLCRLSQLTSRRLCMFHRGFRTGVARSKTMNRYVLKDEE